MNASEVDRVGAYHVGRERVRELAIGELGVPAAQLEADAGPVGEVVSAPDQGDPQLGGLAGDEWVNPGVQVARLGRLAFVAIEGAVCCSQPALCDDGARRLKLGAAVVVGLRELLGQPRDDPGVVAG